MGKPTQRIAEQRDQPLLQAFNLARSRRCAAVALGPSAGVIAPFHRIASLRAVVPTEVRRLVGLSLAGFGLFYALATWLMLRSNRILLE